MLYFEFENELKFYNLEAMVYLVYYSEEHFVNSRPDDQRFV